MNCGGHPILGDTLLEHSASIFSGRGQMAEEVQTTKQDNEPVRIAVWYDYI